MSSAASKTRITVEEYLNRERAAGFRSEFHDGQIFPMDDTPRGMAGTSLRHNLIAGNIYSEIRRQLRDSPCHPYFGDVRVSVLPTGLYTYPDVLVVCDPPQFQDATLDTLLNPTVIVEVLSHSTEAWDRGGKFAHYRRLDSLREYVLVTQDNVRVERYSRHGTDWLLKEWVFLDDILRLDAIDCELTLREIYAKVMFAADQAPPQG